MYRNDVGNVEVTNARKQLRLPRVVTEKLSEGHLCRCLMCEPQFEADLVGRVELEVSEGHLWRGLTCDPGFEADLIKRIKLKAMEN